MTPSLHGAVAAPEGGLKGRREAWFVFAALLLTALIPGLSKAYVQGDAPPDSGLNQVLWGVLYVVTALRVRSLAPDLGQILSKSIALWSFGLLLLLSTLWSVAPLVSLKESIEMIGTMVIGLYIVLRFPLAQFLDILSVVFGTIATISLALVVGAPGRGRMDWGGGAWSGVYQEKNLLGAAMALAIFSLALMLPQARGRKRLRVLATLILCGLLLYGSDSITAIVDCIAVLVLSFAVLLCTSPKYGVAARILLVAAALFGGFASLAFGFNAAGLPAILGRGGSLTGRTDFWPYLYQAIADRPLLGYGYDAFFVAPVSQDYLSYYVVGSFGWFPYHAHNSFLQILLNVGYVGLALFIVILVQGFSWAVRYLGRERSAAACWPLAVLVYLVVGSYTESYLGGYNSFESLFFVAAYLYPVRSALMYAERRSSS
jgi:exopolysaccharide production protein ExoQ